VHANVSRTFKALSVAVVLCALGVVVMAVSGALATVAPISEDSHPVLPSLGVTTHLSGLTDAGRRVEFARLATMGTSWIRVGVPWYSVQPTARTVSASELGALDQIMAEATTAGMRVLFIGDQAPSWAGGGGATASMPAAYGSFMGMLAEHFRGRGLHGTSPAYEIMNEPDGRGENGQPRATPSDYAAAACSAFHAIKSQDRGAIVVTGALDVSDWQPWLRAAFQAGLGTCFDVLSAHPYAHLDVLDQIRAVAGVEGSPDVRIWVTEFGFSTCDDLQQSCVSEADQAILLVKRLEELRRYYPWVTVAMIYEDRDEPSNPGTPPERAFGLLKTTDNGAGVGAKPAVAAIEALYRGA
jgi:Glycosyl hydrolase catalytic core